MVLKYLNIYSCIAVIQVGHKFKFCYFGVSSMKIRLSCIFFILLFSSNAFALADVPSNVTLSATEETIKVDWVGDTDADSYFVYWGISRDNLDNRATVDDSVTEYTITNLEQGTTYYIAVSSNDNFQESDLSEIQSIATTKDTGRPATPAGFFILGLNAIAESTVALKWNQNTESDLDHYNIYYGRTSGAYANVLEAGGADTTSYTVTALQNSTRYYFSITAVDTAGNESEKADELIVDTREDNRPPNKPAGISGALSDTDAITVDIVNGNSQMADFSGTILYYGNAADNLNQRVDIEDRFSHTVSDLPVDSVWFFSATAYDFSGNESNPTQVISVTVEDTYRFLNQPEDFDGGCFIATAGQSHGSGIYFPFLMMGALLVFFKRNVFLKFLRFAVVTFVLVLFSSGHSSAEVPAMPEMPGNNIVGVAGGYYLPLEDDFDDFYGENTFPVYGFYERFFSKFVSVDLEAGFLKEKGHLLTQTGEQTEIRTMLTLAPVSASLKFNMKILPYVVGYIGVGPDYWYCQEETDDMDRHPEIEEWVGGFHGKIGARFYNTDEDFTGTGVLIESSYSQIDRFGDNKTDIGGWAFKFGLFYHF